MFVNPSRLHMLTEHYSKNPPVSHFNPGMQICTKITNMTLNFKKGWKYHINLFKRKFIETKNIFAIRDKKPFLFQLLACKQDTQSVSQRKCNSISSSLPQVSHEIARRMRITSAFRVQFSFSTVIIYAEKIFYFYLQVS